MVSPACSSTIRPTSTAACAWCGRSSRTLSSPPGSVQRRTSGCETCSWATGIFVSTSTCSSRCCIPRPPIAGDRAVTWSPSSWEGGRVLESRWRGQPGRLEVWYSSLTDPATGTGIWIHHEVVAPADAGAAFAHGWIAVFEPGASPLLRRFGPEPWQEPLRGFSCGTVRYDGDLTGSAGEVSWELAAEATDAPLYTFPRWAWRREVLPAAQVVPRPNTRYSGTVQLADRRLTLRDAVGADARIYGQGNARRWGWLHADLGGGDVCEVVAAVSMRP